MPRTKSAVIKFRTTQPRKKFLTDLVKEMNAGRNPETKITLSDLVDSIVQYFMMSYTLGEFTKPLAELRKEFLSFLKGVSEGKK